MHKSIQPTFSDAVKDLQEDNRPINEDYSDAVEQYYTTMDPAIVHLRDFDHTYDAIRYIQSRFLRRIDGRFTERIQHLYMRIAAALHLTDVPKVLATYELLSRRLITMDPCVSLLAGTDEKVLSSQFSINVSNCTVPEMYNAVAKCVFAVRKGASVAIAAQGVPCSGRNPVCDHRESDIGLWALMSFMDTAFTFTRSHGDKRTDPANVAVEVWHIDVRSIIDFNNIHQHDLVDQRNLTVTLCLPDIFMGRVEDNGEWALFCPKNVPDLLNTSGSYFDDAYHRYELSAIPRIKVRAKELWHTILRSIILTGGPYLIFKDSMNGKSNLPEASPSCQSMLRTGMVDVLGEDAELFPRNYASLTLPLFMTRDREFDFADLHQATKETVYALNKVLDISEDHLSTIFDRNKDFRSIAIGVNGLADLFTAMRMPYESLEAADLNINIAETMYHAALEASNELAAIHGPYKAFRHSPMAHGIMQFDFWETTPSDRYDWKSLCDKIHTTGVRNASLISIGPGDDGEVPSGFTTSTNPLPSNLLDGHIPCPWLVEDLTKLGLWNDEIRREITTAKGSIQGIRIIPADIKAIYRTAWEIDPQCIAKMAVDRAPFICNTQSITFHLHNPNVDVLDELMRRMWSSGLKTGIHTLHSRFPDQAGSRSSLDEDTDREMSYEEVDTDSTLHDFATANVLLA
ncbi:ribonucleotide reductase [Mycena metata]|uniref:Ribonucleotide reductase n=1 Tax=Mycena metata TaxID=1033252 RepID=A0AAD7HQ94_9AGAR|nr:ribonucleotide reductase [Mycena metata]